MATATNIELVSSVKSFGGYQKVYSHQSVELCCQMKFAIYLPSDDTTTKYPVLYWLSGLTCDENNFIQKAGAQRYASELGIIIVCPDTSPRNVNIAGEDESYDFGSGAGFYVNATKSPWQTNYRMYSYITDELRQVVAANFPIQVNKESIFGHSMGGHGALISALRNPGLYKSVSAFAPICNPIECAWGKKAFTGYLGDSDTEKESWKQYDATELILNYKGPELEILIDQGTSDNFLTQQQLLPENLLAAHKKRTDETSIKIKYNAREAYDHSYFFIASFVGDHIRFHSEFLK